MSIYEVVQNVIRLLPVMMLLPAFMFLLRVVWYKRLGIMFLLGWLVIAGSTMLYWSYSVRFAPNQEVLNELIQGDGASKVFGVLFGWFFSLVLLFMFELVRLIYLGLNSAIAKLKKTNI